MSVAFGLKLNRLVTTPKTPAQNYDGVHVWLHYQSPSTLYYASVSRRDGEVLLGKKIDGRYVHLTQPKELRFPFVWIFDAVTFVDVGNVYPRVSDFRLSELRTAGGLGLRVGATSMHASAGLAL